MKILLSQYASYHIWANQLLIDRIQKLPAELKNKVVLSSFSGLEKTLLHMWDAESMWWQRMKLQEQVTRPSDGFSGDIENIIKELTSQSKQWQQWINISQEHIMDHEFIYSNTKKERFKQTIYQMLLHLFNHGTYHRGQLVTILRQLGVTDIPATDFIVWSRKK